MLECTSAEIVSTGTFRICFLWFAVLYLSSYCGIQWGEILSQIAIDRDGELPVTVHEIEPRANYRNITLRCTRVQVQLQKHTSRKTTFPSTLLKQKSNFPEKRKKTDFVFLRASPSSFDVAARRQSADKDNDLACPFFSRAAPS